MKIFIWSTSIFFTVIFYGCISGKKTKLNTDSHSTISKDSLRILRDKEQFIMKTAINKIDCSGDCKQYYECSKQLLNYKDGVYDNKFNRLISCSVSLAKTGNMDIEQHLVNYFNNVYEFLKPSISRNVVSNALFEHELKQLRSPAAFEVAMKYGSHGQWNENYDGIGGNHSGLKFLGKVLFPMIKSIDGVLPWEYYEKIRHSDLEKFGSSLTGGGGLSLCREKSEGDLKHKDQYDVLLEAWKDGKIILKQYGE